tara:strand:+ start:121 stop:672 length:552 start_codon:yes stop_codon:yes gene_type:complete
MINIQAAETSKNAKAYQVKRTSHWANELIQRHIRLSTYLVVTFFAHRYTFPLEAAAKGWSLNWIGIIVGRNLFLMLFFVGGWHYYLYDRVSSNPTYLRSVKFNDKNQYEKGNKNLRREQLYTTFGFLMSSFYEVVVIRLWATKSPWICPYYENFWSFPIWSIVQILIVGYWRDFHFYWCHRFM